jgi:predicted amidophosphoribosyltransferase
MARSREERKVATPGSYRRAVLLASVCVVCRSRGNAVCDTCARRLIDAPADSPALFRYEGTGRELALALKRNPGRAAINWLAERIATAVDRPDLVTWPPTARARRYARGFDQAELLARAVAMRLGCPARATLRRTSTYAQHGRSRADRLEGPSFVATRPIVGSVLLVDDVITTGATLGAAERCLRKAGALDVQAIAVAAAEARTVAKCELRPIPRASSAHFAEVPKAGE